MPVNLVVALLAGNFNLRKQLSKTKLGKTKPFISTGKSNYEKILCYVLRNYMRKKFVRENVFVS
jgi:hypothetical protein